MSEYQRYEFMTIDQPLTQDQIEEVQELSSHIEVTPTHAVVEYNYGDFKYDAIEVLHDFFDGFLYWANWGTPQLALRFPHGVISPDLINSYDFDDLVTFTTHADYDILDIHFTELEGPDEWTDYELGSMISIRDELMEGDLRSLYIVWLAVRNIIEFDDGQDTTLNVPPIPPDFKKLTSAHYALAELLQLNPDLLAAAANHSETSGPAAQDDFPAWIEMLPQTRRSDYLLRLANKEPGLSRQLVLELRELGRGKKEATAPQGERIRYSALLAEAKSIKAKIAREQREEERRARESKLQQIHEHQEEYWREINQEIERKTSASYDKTVRLLLDLREAQQHFNEEAQFQARFQQWVQPYQTRTAFVKRLRAQDFI